MDSKKLGSFVRLAINLASILVIVTVGHRVVAQTTQPKPEPPAPTISEENHARIRDTQRKMDKLVITALQLQKQQQEIEKQYAAANGELENAITKAMIDAKADGREWTLDRENLTFKKNPAPPPPPKPEEKPAEKKKP